MAVEAAPSILCMADAVLGITETPKIFMVKKLKENMHTILETMYLCMYTYIYIHMQKKNIYMWWLSALPSHFFPRDERSGTEWDGLYSGLAVLQEMVVVQYDSPMITDPVIHIVNNIYDFIAIPSDFQLLTSCSSRICPVHRKQRSSYLAPGRAAARTFHELLGVWSWPQWIHDSMGNDPKKVRYERYRYIYICIL